uniref:Uncharacterized protein n=1 Tax=viral metagenome TaxID=1070528 RepID=A0A6M3KSE8_9ZZZZ
MPQSLLVLCDGDCKKTFDMDSEDGKSVMETGYCLKDYDKEVRERFLRQPDFKEREY